MNGTERAMVKIMTYCVLLLLAWNALVWVTGCAPTPVSVTEPHTRCVGDVHTYRLTPDGHKWYLDCVNQH
jgi:hypothetical protein